MVRAATGRTVGAVPVAAVVCKRCGSAWEADDDDSVGGNVEEENQEDDGFKTVDVDGKFEVTRSRSDENDDKTFCENERDEDEACF